MKHLLAGSIRIDIDRALCGQGIQAPARAGPRVRALQRELLADARIRNLWQPAAACESYSIEEVQGGVTLPDGVVFGEPNLASSCHSAGHIVAAVATIGPKLEEEVARLFAAEESLRAVVLDGLGNAVLDLVTAKVRELAAQVASGYGCGAGRPVFPGSGELPLSAQPTIVQLSAAAEIGVRVTSSGMMSPLKTVSMIIPLTPGAAAAPGETPCLCCNLAETCRYQ